MASTSKRPATNRPAQAEGPLGPLAGVLRETEVTMPLEEYLRLTNCRITATAGDMVSSPNAARSLNLIYNGMDEEPANTNKKGPQCISQRRFIGITSAES